MKKSIGRKIFSLAKTPIGDLIVGLAFGKLSNLLPVKKIRETDRVVAFWHPVPFWEKHILIVPKKKIKKLTQITNKNYTYINEVVMVANDIVRDLGWEKDGYTLLVNGGKRQEVNQLHFHLVSGKEISK